MASMLFCLFIGCLLGLVAGECPNACSSHGKCGAYDMVLPPPMALPFLLP